MPSKLLAEHRGVRNLADLPDLTIEQIVAWADAYKAASSDWPTRASGQIVGTDESWSRIDVALKGGGRGLPGGTSLAKVLAKYRGVRNAMDLPSLTVEQILRWIDAYKEAMGEWPTRASGRITGSDETWSGVSTALVEGVRGLPGGSSLAKLFGRTTRFAKHGRFAVPDHRPNPRLGGRTQFCNWSLANNEVRASHGH